MSTSKVQKTVILFLLVVLLKSTSLLSQDHSIAQEKSIEASQTHVITVGEYHAFSKATGANDATNIIVDEKKDEPMLGLTKLDAMRFCNWVENGCLAQKDVGYKAIASTETGSYVLQGNELILINSTAMYHLAENEADQNGARAFAITAESDDYANVTSSPLMMFGGEEKENSSDKKQTASSQETEGRRQTGENSSDSENSSSQVVRGALATGIAEKTSSGEKSGNENLTALLIPPPTLHLILHEDAEQKTMKKIFVQGENPTNYYQQADTLLPASEQAWKERAALQQTCQIKEEVLAQAREKFEQEEILLNSKNLNKTLLGKTANAADKLSNMTGFLNTPFVSLSGVAQAVSTEADIVNRGWEKKSYKKAKRALEKATGEAEAIQKQFNEAEERAFAADRARKEPEQQAKDNEQQTVLTDAIKLKPPLQSQDTSSWQRWAEGLARETKISSSETMAFAMKAQADPTWAAQQAIQAWMGRMQASEEKIINITQQAKSELAPVEKAYLAAQRKADHARATADVAQEQFDQLIQAEEEAQENYDEARAFLHQLEKQKPKKNISKATQQTVEASVVLEKAKQERKKHEQTYQQLAATTEHIALNAEEEALRLFQQKENIEKAFELKKERAQHFLTSEKIAWRKVWPEEVLFLKLQNKTAEQASAKAFKTRSEEAWHSAEQEAQDLEKLWQTMRVPQQEAHWKNQASLLATKKAIAHIQELWKEFANAVETFVENPNYDSNFKNSQIVVQRADVITQAAEQMGVTSTIPAVRAGATLIARAIRNVSTVAKKTTNTQKAVSNDWKDIAHDTTAKAIKAAELAESLWKEDASWMASAIQEAAAFAKTITQSGHSTINANFLNLGDLQELHEMLADIKNSYQKNIRYMRARRNLAGRALEPQKKVLLERKKSFYRSDRKWKGERRLLDVRKKLAASWKETSQKFYSQKILEDEKAVSDFSKSPQSPQHSEQQIAQGIPSSPVRTIDNEEQFLQNEIYTNMRKTVLAQLALDTLQESETKRNEVSVATAVVEHALPAIVQQESVDLDIPAEEARLVQSRTLLDEEKIAIDKTEEALHSREKKIAQEEKVIDQQAEGLKLQEQSLARGWRELAEEKAAMMKQQEQTSEEQEVLEKKRVALKAEEMRIAQEREALVKKAESAAAQVAIPLDYAASGQLWEKIDNVTELESAAEAAEINVAEQACNQAREEAVNIELLWEEILKQNEKKFAAATLPSEKTRLTFEIKTARNAKDTWAAKAAEWEIRAAEAAKKAEESISVAQILNDAETKIQTTAESEKNVKAVVSPPVVVKKEIKVNDRAGIIIWDSEALAAAQLSHAIDFPNLRFSHPHSKLASSLVRTQFVNAMKSWSNFSKTIQIFKEDPSESHFQEARAMAMSAREALYIASEAVGLFGLGDAACAAADAAYAAANANRAATSEAAARGSDWAGDATKNVDRAIQTAAVAMGTSWEKEAQWTISAAREAAEFAQVVKEFYALGKITSKSSSATENSAVPRRGLTNNRADCFINSSLQLCKAFREQLDRNELARMPFLELFLHERLNGSEDCRRLREEMASEVIKDNQDLRGVIQDGTAQTHQDAAAFLRLLLAETKAPKIFFEETLENRANGLTRAGNSTASEQMLQLTLLADDGTSIAMQDLVNDKLVSTRQQRWIDEDLNSPAVEVKSSLTLKGPIPSTLIVSIGRFGFDAHGIKNQKTISGFKDRITLPATNGERITYEPTAIICHLGNSLEEGHYFTHRKENGIWQAFNDEEITTSRLQADGTASKNCYVISCRRVGNEINSEAALINKYLENEIKNNIYTTCLVNVAAKLVNQAREEGKNSNDVFKRAEASSNKTLSLATQKVREIDQEYAGMMNEAILTHAMVGRTRDDLTKRYHEADFRWTDLQTTWEVSNKARQEASIKKEVLLRAQEQLELALQADNGQLRLGDIARRAGRMAEILNNVPDPHAQMAAGAARVVANGVDRINQFFMQVDRSRAQAQVSLAAREAEVATQTVNDKMMSIVSYARDAEEAEAQARAAEIASTKVIATSIRLNSTLTTDEVAATWRERMRLSEQNIKNHTAQQEVLLQPISIAFTQAEENRTAARAGANECKEKLAMAMTIKNDLKTRIENITQELDQVEQNPNTLDPTRIMEKRIEFTQIFAQLEKIQNNITTLEEALGKASITAIAQESKVIQLSTKYEAAKKQLLRNIERASVHFEADRAAWREVWPEYDQTFRSYFQWELPFEEELLQQPHLEFENSEIHQPEQLHEELIAQGRRYLYQAKKKIEETLHPKLNISKNSSALAAAFTESNIDPFLDEISQTPREAFLAWSLNQVDHPTSTDQERWETWRQCERLRQKHNQLARALKQEQNSLNNSEMETLFSWKDKKTPTRLSYFSTGTFNIATTTEAKATVSETLQEQFQRTYELEKKAQERWVQFVQQSEQARVKAGGQSFETEAEALDAWNQADQKAINLQEQQQKIIQETQASEAMEKNWKANNERWRARAAVDLAARHLSEFIVSQGARAQEAQAERQLQEFYHELDRVKKEAIQAEATWQELAKKQKNIIKAQQTGDAKDLKLALEELAELDRAVLRRWDQFQESQGPLDIDTAEAHQESSRYSIELALRLQQVEKTAFSTAPTVEQGTKNYKQIAIEEALQAARENIFGATEAWNERVSRSQHQLESSEQQANASETSEREKRRLRDLLPQLRGVAEADKKAQTIFEKEKRRLDQIEILWKSIITAQREAKNRKLQEAAQHYHQGDSTAWENLTGREREIYNDQIHEKNYCYFQEIASEGNFLASTKEKLDAEQQSLEKKKKGIFSSLLGLGKKAKETEVFLLEALPHYNERYEALKKRKVEEEEALRWAKMSFLEREQYIYDQISFKKTKIQQQRLK